LVAPPVDPVLGLLPEQPARTSDPATAVAARAIKPARCFVKEVMPLKSLSVMGAGPSGRDCAASRVVAS